MPRERGPKLHGLERFILMALADDPLTKEVIIQKFYRFATRLTHTACAVVSDHLVGVKHIAPNLISPASGDMFPLSLVCSSAFLSNSKLRRWERRTLSAVSLFLR
jgi:hypothetical protein